MLSYPSGMTVSSRALNLLADATARAAAPSAGPAGASCPPAARPCWWWPTCARARPTPIWPAGSGSAPPRSTATSARRSTCSRRWRPTLEQAIEVARRKAFVILDGTLLRIDRVGMASGRDRAFYSGKHKAHGVNVQVIADPIGRLVWISPPLPGARHDMGAAREHGIIDALTAAEIPAVADTAYQGAGPTVAVPQRRRRLDPDTGRYRRLSREPEGRQHRPRPPPRTRRAGQRRAEELAILRKIRSSPNSAAKLVAAVQTLMIASA